MAWSIFPVNDTSGWSYKAALNELMRAFNERYLIRSNDPLEITTWPPGITPWEFFYIDSVDADGLYVHADTDENGDPISWPISRWYNFVDPDPNFAFLPAFYDLCIYTGTEDQFDRLPEKMVRVPIVANTETTLQLGKTLNDWVNGNVFSSLASLVGKKAWIVAQNNGTNNYPFWHDRWRLGFNDGSYWSVGTATSGNPSGIRFELHSYDRDIVQNEFASKYLYGYATDGDLYRSQINGNSASFGTPTRYCDLYLPSGVEFNNSLEIYNSSSNRYWPAQDAWPGLFRWYGGYMDNYMSHGANGSLQYESPIAATSIPMDIIPDISALDIDAHTLFDELDAPADYWYAPHFYRSIRTLQKAIEDESTAWVEDTNHDNNPNIHNFTVAEAFEGAGINNYNTTAAVGSTTSGQVDFSINLPSHGFGTDVYYTLLTHRNVVIFSGIMENQSSTSVSFTVGESYDGKTFTLVYSWGWTREIPRRVLSLYDKSIFFPDYDDDEENPQLVDPPTEMFPGYWETYSKSTEYAEYDKRGFLQEGYGSFVPGQKAIYVGDNKYTGNILGFSEQISIDPSDYNPYINNGAFGDLPLATQAIHDASLTGTVTSGNHRFLIDNTKDWWDPIWHSEQPSMPVHTGNATGGSLTTLIDNTKIGNGYWDETTGRFFDFIVVFSSGVNAGLRVPCTNFDDTTATLTLREEYLGASIQAGDGYEIREPTSYELNKWQNRKLILNTGSGTSYNTTILYSDDQSLHFEEIAEPVQPGWTYQIVDIRVGHTVVRTSDGWEDDSRPQAREPDHLTRYGRNRRGDYTPALLLNEMYLMIDQLSALLHGYGWTAKGENNTWSPDGDIEIIFNYTEPPFEIDGIVYDWAEAWDVLENGRPSIGYTFGFREIWENGSATGPVDAAPTTATTTFNEDFFAGNTDGAATFANAAARYAYPSGNGVPVVKSSTTTFYARASSTDDAESATETEEAGVERNVNVFDPGLTGLHFNTFTNIGSVTSSDSHRVGARLGDPIEELPPFFKAPDLLQEAGVIEIERRYNGYSIFEEAMVSTFRANMDYVT